MSKINIKTYPHKLKYYPSVDVIMIVSRPQLDGYYLQALNSFIHSVYSGKMNLIEIDNLDKSLTIGKAWNMAVDKSTADYVFFLGDDDYINGDLISSSIIAADNYHASTGKDPDFIGSGFMAVDEKNRFLELRTEQPTGLWKREYVQKLRFDETLTSLVDTDFFHRAEASGVNDCIMSHHFGYYYRQHENMISGRKTELV